MRKGQGRAGQGRQGGHSDPQTDVDGQHWVVYHACWFLGSPLALYSPSLPTPDFGGKRYTRESVPFPFTGVLFPDPKRRGKGLIQRATSKSPPGVLRMSLVRIAFSRQPGICRVPKSLFPEGVQLLGEGEGGEGGDTVGATGIFSAGGGVDLGELAAIAYGPQRTHTGHVQYLDLANHKAAGFVGA